VKGTGNFSILPSGGRPREHLSWKSSLPPYLLLLLFLTFLTPVVVYAESPPVLEVGRFSAAAEGQRLPVGWKPLTFPTIERHTTYTLAKEDGTTVVKAMSDASAAGLTREIKVNLNQYPILSWRWKVTNVLKHGDVTKKEGDDYPARLYITFEFDPVKAGFVEKAKFEIYKLIYGQYPPLAAVNYIWESKAPKGTIVSSPYTAHSKMIVVESGPALVNQWVDEQRNLLEDYKKAFGEEPPLVSGVAIMTDTDNTGESAIAYYGDIVFTQRASDSDNPATK
jgi:hypothetical protein